MHFRKRTKCLQLWGYDYILPLPQYYRSILSVDSLLLDITQFRNINICTNNSWLSHKPDIMSSPAQQLCNSTTILIHIEGKSTDSHLLYSQQKLFRKLKKTLSIESISSYRIVLTLTLTHVRLHSHTLLSPVGCWLLTGPLYSDFFHAWSWGVRTFDISELVNDVCAQISHLV